MTQMNIAATTSLDAWAQSGGAIVGMTETAIATDEGLHAAAYTADAIFSHEPALEMNAAAITIGTVCLGLGAELSSAALTMGIRIACSIER
ncbi:hypothetical protein ACTU44_03180 [Thalassospira sp. SM2505]